MKRPRIILQGIQVKSLEKARRLASALDVIEVECGIREVEIRFESPFICPWIDLAKLDRTPMERLLRDLFIRLGKQQRRDNRATGQRRRIMGQESKSSARRQKHTG